MIETIIYTRSYQFSFCSKNSNGAVMNLISQRLINRTYMN